ncbi:D,D-heptose 1,7-bisphosphate phosphatase [bacterium]|nr:MAG: D,D-heptose 1,7-bisphosphate phosphatase [bacterium]
MEDSPRKAVFVDRDGTLIVEKGFLSDPDGVEVIPGAIEAVKKLNDEGFAVIVVSNQSGVARGYFGEDAVVKVNDRVKSLFAEGGAKIDALYYCPHYADGSVEEYAIDCPCRKPGTGMVEKAVRELNVVPAFVIGDRKSDVELGKNLGVPAVLVLSGYGREQPDEVVKMADFVAKDISSAVDWILNSLKTER